MPRKLENDDQLLRVNPLRIHRTQKASDPITYVDLMSDPKGKKFVIRKGMTMGDRPLEEDRLDQFEQEFTLTQEMGRLTSHVPYAWDLRINPHQSEISFLCDHIEGHSLEQIIENGPLPIAYIRQVSLRVAEALRITHQHDIIHRDIKPGNIMITHEGGSPHVHLLDWGAACEYPTTDPIKPYGTPAYLAPESIQQDDERKLNSDVITPAVDVYALGILIYKMLTQDLPFGAQDFLKSAKTKKNPWPFSYFGFEYPAELQRVIFKAIHKHQDTRYKTVQGFKKALGNAFAPIAKNPSKTINDFRRIEDEGPSLSDLEDIEFLDEDEYKAPLAAAARGE